MNRSNLRASLRSSLQRASQGLAFADEAAKTPTCPAEVMVVQLAFEQALSQTSGRDLLWVLLACEVHEWLKALDLNPQLRLSPDDQEDLFERLRFSDIELNQSNTAFLQDPRQSLMQIKKSLDLKLQGQTKP
jgi:hypothetical protein